MNRLTEDQPSTNFLTLMNFALCGDDGATFLRYAEEPMVRLTDYMLKQCQKHGCDCNKINAEAEDGFMGCSDCHLAILYYCAVQGAELRDKLARYEDSGLEPEEIAALVIDNKQLHKLVDAAQKILWED